MWEGGTADGTKDLGCFLVRPIVNHLHDHVGYRHVRGSFSLKKSPPWSCSRAGLFRSNLLNDMGHIKESPREVGVAGEHGMKQVSLPASRMSAMVWNCEKSILGEYAGVSGRALFLPSPRFEDLAQFGVPC